MKTIISIIAAVLILTSCNSGPSSDNENKDKDRVGKEIEDDTELENKLIVNTQLCDLESEDEFIFNEKDIFSGELELKTKNGAMIKGDYILVGEDKLIINIMGASQEAFFERIAIDKMTLSFVNAGSEDVQNFKVCN